jgi:hypothetical protein
MEDENAVTKFPFADAIVRAEVGDANISVDVKSTLEIIQISGLDAARTLDLVPSSDLMPGSKVVVDVEQGATAQNVAFGSTGSTIVAADLVGVANDRDVITLMWDGTEFVGLSAWVKIVDAV